MREDAKGSRRVRGGTLRETVFSCARGLQRGAERLHAVALLPRDAQLLAAHVTVGGELTVDRAAQVEVADDGGRAQVKDLLDGLLELRIGCLLYTSDAADE